MPIPISSGRTSLFCRRCGFLRSFLWKAAIVSALFSTVGIGAQSREIGQPVRNYPSGQAVTADAAHLTVVPAHGVIVSGDQRGTYDFGQVSLLERLKIEQIFTLRNDGSTPLTVNRLQGSCGCTSAVARTRKGVTAPAVSDPLSPLPTLAAGEELEITVTLDLPHLAPGPQHKFVFVYAQGSPEAAAVCEMTGRLIPSVELSPTPVDFGVITAGQEKTLTVTAAFDSRMSSVISAPFISSNTAVHVAEIRSSVNQPRRTFQVTVDKDAPIGTLIGTLWFPPPAHASSIRNTSLPPVPTPLVSAALSSARLTFVGQVVGDAAAQPQALAIGTVAQGTSANRQIILVGKNAGTLEKLRVTSANALVTVHIGPTASISSNPAKTLDIILAAGAPAGVFQSELTVILANGQRLIIPITAYVKP